MPIIDLELFKKPGIDVEYKDKDGNIQLAQLTEFLFCDRLDAQVLSLEQNDLLKKIKESQDQNERMELSIKYEDITNKFIMLFFPELPYYYIKNEMSLNAKEELKYQCKEYMNKDSDEIEKVFKGLDLDAGKKEEKEEKK